MKEGWKLQFSCDDIHEANIIVTEDGKPYIIDFDQFGYLSSLYSFQTITKY